MYVTTRGKVWTAHQDYPSNYVIGNTLQRIAK